MLSINRIYQSDCTIGVLTFNDFRCFTLELPWLDNKTSVSCIPSGRYQAKKMISPLLGECIEIFNVLNRSYIRIHAGNYTSQILGCVLVGDSLKDINGDGIIDVTNSKATLKNLMAALPDSFEIEIE